MKQMWQHRGMRLIFLANLVSMIGSGMNSAAVIWYILQATHSEVSLGMLIALQTLPSMLLLPFTGVLIDREDHRHLMMWLDAARGAIILFVAMLVLTHHVRLWQLYAMNVLVAIGFWMFFPTVNALIQELTPDDKMVDSNSLFLAALQGGWLLAGAIVGFMYNHIGLGGVLLIDSASYAVSIACVFCVRKGRVIVSRPVAPDADAEVAPAPSTAVQRFMHELAEGNRFVWQNKPVLFIGVAWALFVASMMTQGVLSAPLSERILHGGAVGYGWINAGWATGAFVSVFYAATFIRRRGAHRSVTITMSVIALSLFLLPASRWLVFAVPVYFIMGSSRGVGGIALSSEMMEIVPRYMMGRVQNMFSFGASALQIATSLIAGEAAHRNGLTYGFWIVGAMYLGAAFAAWWPVRHGAVETHRASETAAD
ncbi:MAG: MFS transporter [Candidatus Korobacteraceae bacterium]